MTDTPMRVLIGVCLALWTAFVVVVTALLVGSQVEPVRLDLGTVTIDRDGRWMTPQDLNGDGKITGDIELGS